MYNLFSRMSKVDQTKDRENFQNENHQDKDNIYTTNNNENIQQLKDEIKNLKDKFQFQERRYSALDIKYTKLLDQKEILQLKMKDYEILNSKYQKAKQNLQQTQEVINDLQIKHEIVHNKNQKQLYESLEELNIPQNIYQQHEQLFDSLLDSFITIKQKLTQSQQQVDDMKIQFCKYKSENLSLQHQIYDLQKSNEDLIKEKNHNERQLKKYNEKVNLNYINELQSPKVSQQNYITQGYKSKNKFDFNFKNEISQDEINSPYRKKKQTIQPQSLAEFQKQTTQGLASLQEIEYEEPKNLSKYFSSVKRNQEKQLLFNQTHTAITEFQSQNQKESQIQNNENKIDIIKKKLSTINSINSQQRINLNH